MTRSVKKSLIGLEDMTLGEGVVSQTRNLGSYDITQFRYVYPVNSSVELNALDTTIFTKARLYTGDITTPPIDYEFIAGSWEQTSVGGGSSVASLSEVASATVTNNDILQYNGDTEVWEVIDIALALDLTADYIWTGDHTFDEYIQVVNGIMGLNTVRDAVFSLIQNVDGAVTLGSATKTATIKSTDVVNHIIGGTTYKSFDELNIKEAVIPINAQTGTTYTTAIGDRGSMVTLSNAAAIVLTIPLNATVAYPIGTSIAGVQLGAGQVTIFPTVGVTLNSEIGLKTTAQYSQFTLLKIDTDTWLVTGSLEA